MVNWRIWKPFWKTHSIRPPVAWFARRVVKWVFLEGTSIAGREGIWWDADNLRKDETKAVCGEAIVSLNDNTDLTVGLRAFDVKI